MSDKLIAIAKECGVRVNWKHGDQDGWRMVPVGVSSVTMTPDQLHAYTEKVCKQMVEFVKEQATVDAIMRIEGKAKTVLAAYTEIMGDKK